MEENKQKSITKLSLKDFKEEAGVTNVIEQITWSL